MTKPSFQFLPIALILLSSAVPAAAQKRASKAHAAAEPQVVQAEAADDLAKFRQDFIKAAEEHKASLQALAGSYETSLRKLSEQHDKLKELYTDGIIARREVEASDAALVEAQAKIDGVRKELASVETTLVAARNPVAAPADAGPLGTLARVEPKWTTGSAKIDGLIRLYGRQYGVDPYLVYCVMHQESRFGSGAVSHKGAQGLMQLMPGTAARYGVTNSFDPAQNIQGGTRYLRDLLRLFGGDVRLALAGYNAGEGAVLKYGRRVPPYSETQNYVRVIGSRYAQGSGVALTSKTATPAAKSTKGTKK